MTPKQAFTVSIVAIAAFVAAHVHLQAAKPGRANLPVIVSFHDRVGDGVVSDGGSYVDGVSNVSAILTGNSEGNLVLDTNAQNGDGGRRVCFHFGSQGLPSGFPSQRCEDVFTAMRSVNFDGADDLRSLVYQQAFQKRLNISWADSVARVTYYVRWNGETSLGQTFITVTCTDPSATEPGSCTQWSASPDGPAGLYSTPLKGNSTQTYLGTYSLPFLLTIDKK